VTERLFFALWPGEPQRAALAGVQRGLRKHRGRLAHPEDLHTTLVFLGDIKADRRACAEAAADGVRAAPFELTLDRCGSFPRAGILWCGASERPQSLLDLLHALNGGLLGCGFKPERRPFIPHVTLARKARPLQARELDPPIAWPVAEFRLVLARPGERPRYQPVRSWPLVS
jgi:2'-5' RNA ligase